MELVSVVEEKKQRLDNDTPDDTLGVDGYAVESGDRVCNFHSSWSS